MSFLQSNVQLCATMYDVQQGTSINQSRFVSLDFNEGEVLKIIRPLNIPKAHDHDDIYIRI